MSTMIGPSSYGPLDRMLGSLASQQAEYGVLQQQTATGKVATSYAGLGPVSGQVVDLTAATSRLDAYGQAITTAQG